MAWLAAPALLLAGHPLCEFTTRIRRSGALRFEPPGFDIAVADLFERQAE